MDASRSGAGAQPSIDELAADLRVVVGRVRSPAGLDELDLPAVDALTGGDRTRLEDLVVAAIGRIDSADYREFLTLLLPFPFTPAAPWEQLGPNRHTDGRGERAARAAFDLSWDACNRPGQLLDGRSRRDWAERFLAESLVSGTSVSRPSVSGSVSSGAAPGTATEDPDAVPEESRSGAASSAAKGAPTPASGTGRHGRAPAVTASIIVAVLALGGLFVAVSARDSGGSDDRAENAAPEVEGSMTLRTDPISCAAIGALDSTASELPSSEQISQQFVDLYPTLPEGTGCPLRPAYVWDELVVQELDSGEEGLPAAMLVGRIPGTTGVYLTPTAYTRYRTLGSGDGRLAQGLGGLPSQVVTLPDGHQEVELSKGVLFVAETEGAPFFWIPAEFVQLWRDTPELGRPTANPLPSLVQDYQYGFGHLHQQDALPTIEPVADPGAELPPEAQLAGKVLRQEDGTAWWVGRDGKRYWIGTGGVWDCLVDGRDDEVGTVRGYAIATLPYGGHAECPKSGS